MTMSNPTKFNKLADLAAMGEARRRYEKLSCAEQKQEKLNHLRMFVRQLANTEQGRLDLELRLRLLGPCDPRPDEDSMSYYGRLRRWLDIDLAARLDPALNR
jgi:hypothetical protein